MSAAVKIMGLTAIAAAGVAAAIALWPHEPDIGTIDLSTTVKTSSGPAMCPWREPAKDMQAFFPGATSFTEETAAFSRKTGEIRRRLGSRYRVETTALHLYRIHRGNSRVGDVVVRRTAGPSGAIEVVIALDTRKRIAGIRVQRQREPPVSAHAITSAEWLHGFSGKSANSPFRIGVDLPALPPESHDAADAVAWAVHACLVEMDEAVTATPHADHEK